MPSSHKNKQRGSKSSRPSLRLSRDHRLLPLPWLERRWNWRRRRSGLEGCSAASPAHCASCPDRRIKLQKRKTNNGPWYRRSLGRGRATKP